MEGKLLKNIQPKQVNIIMSTSLLVLQQKKITLVFEGQVDSEVALRAIYNRDHQRGTPSQMCLSNSVFKGYSSH